MNSRRFVLAVTVLAVVAFVLFVLFVLAGRSASPAAGHGDFSTRIQPSAPSVSADRERLAGVGSIKDLRPVDTTPR